MEENFEFYNEKMYELRKAKGMSQEEFAEKVGVSRQSIYAWESGKSLPDIENLYKICQVLGIETNMLTNLSQVKKKAKINVKKFRKIALRLFIILIVIYIIIAFKHFIIVVNLGNKIKNIGDYNNYSYKYARAELDKNDNSEVFSQEIFYKDNILKIISKTNEETDIEWIDFNNNEEYIFTEKNREKSVRRLESENIEMIKQVYSISSISNNGLITDGILKNFIASILFPFGYRIESTGEYYVLKYGSNDRNFQYDNVQFINKFNGYPVENQKYRSDGKTVYEKYKDIKIDETTDEDVELPNLNDYILIEN